jgi:hypothetical protein
MSSSCNRRIGRGSLADIGTAKYDQTTSTTMATPSDGYRGAVVEESLSKNLHNYIF